MILLVETRREKCTLLLAVPSMSVFLRFIFLFVVLQSEFGGLCSARSEHRADLNIQFNVPPQLYLLGKLTGRIYVEAMLRLAVPSMHVSSQFISCMSYRNPDLKEFAQHGLSIRLVVPHQLCLLDKLTECIYVDRSPAYRRAREEVERTRRAHGRRHPALSSPETANKQTGALCSQVLSRAVESA